ncbi:MAG: hypothetical protein VXW65_10660 [Pseudomonadota bacterium]|nr:hypothetical protein [Pseudomonadota bacterium]
MTKSTGFVAGTLVHTDKGLMPIEQLKVGDMVLSKPESGEGEVAYKRVLKTFKSPEKHRIMRVGVTAPNLTDAVYQNEVAQLTEEQVLIAAKFCENSSSSYCSDPYYVYCTENHLFWTDELSWLAAGDLFPEKLGTELTMFSCYGFKFTESERYMYETPLLKTCIKDLVMLCDQKSGEPREPLGLIDFSKNHPVLIKGLDTQTYPRFICAEPDTKNQPFIDISKDQNHPIHQELRDHGYIRTDEDPFYMERGYTYEGIKDNKELYRSLFREYEKAYLSGSDPQYYKATVYNIEVEDYHTYFVSEVGVWVQSKICG